MAANEVIEFTPQGVMQAELIVAEMLAEDNSLIMTINYLDEHDGVSIHRGFTTPYDDTYPDSIAELAGYMYTCTG